jgi:hypothetical protein
MARTYIRGSVLSGEFLRLFLAAESLDQQADEISLSANAGLLIDFLFIPPDSADR